MQSRGQWQHNRRSKATHFLGQHLTQLPLNYIAHLKYKSFYSAFIDFYILSLHPVNITDLKHLVARKAVGICLMNLFNWPTCKPACVLCLWAEVLSNNQNIPGFILNPDIFAIRHGPADSDYESDWSTWTRVYTETGQRRGRSDYLYIILLLLVSTQ